ncbi:nitroreductase/quinone reductase family protein [Streptomyces sp. NPDC049954]|uniref:nitroreductase/quinone reductase family protein n=1 Tax=Streptomyces sp. NPDC049954 TaxID=3155779 RepID=UPI0034340808
MAEFRENGGVVGGPFEGAPLLLLTTTGAKSGRPHTNPVVCTREEPGRARGSEGPAGRRDQVGSFLVYASNAGGPAHPQWYRNLLADPRAVVEIGPGPARGRTGRPRARAGGGRAGPGPALAGAGGPAPVRLSSGPCPGPADPVPVSVSGVRLGARLSL